MRLKTYRAGSVPEAMAMARAELGVEALILSTKRVGQGVELTAALEQEPEAPQPLEYAEPVQLRPQAPVWAPHLAPPSTIDPALTWHGVPPAIAQRLSAGPLAQTLAAVLRFGALQLAAHGPPLLLTGPPGAGKTLTAARLATRLVLAGTQPLVITADGRRAGAAEELAAYTRLLGLSLVVASQPAVLAKALRHRTAGAPVLIDTSGINPFDLEAMDGIAALAEAAVATPVLVLPAGQDPQEAADIAGAFQAANVTHFLPTRLDMARRLGSVVSAAAAGGMLLSEAGTGQGATDGLTKLTAEVLAARLAQAPVAPAQPIKPRQVLDAQRLY